MLTRVLGQVFGLRLGLIQFRESGSVRGFNGRLLDKQHHVGFE